jgi:hypothetical protein
MAGKSQEELEKEIAKEYAIVTYADYETGLKEGRLVGLRCAACQKVTCYPMPVCQWCGGRELERLELSGEGELETFTVIRVASEGFEEDAPFIPCLVKLAEGASVVGRLEYDPEHATQDLLGKLVKLKGAYTYKGDKFSGGPRTCPVFRVVE